MLWLQRRRRFRPVFWMTLVLGCCCGPLYLCVGGPQATRQDEFVQKVFLTPLALISAIPLAAGVQWLAVWISALTRKAGLRTRCMGVLTAAAVAAVPLASHWRENDMHRYRYAEDHARNLLAGMLPDALVFPSGDHNTFPLVYLVYVEGYRSDVTVADKYGYIDLALYREMPGNPGKPRTREERQAIEEWIIRSAHRPVYYTVKKPPPVDRTQTVSVGLGYHLLPEGHPCDVTSCWARIRYRNLQGIRAPEDYAAANILADYRYALGTRALEEGDHHGAMQQFAEAARHAWDVKEVYNNIGSTLAEAGLTGEGVGYYEQAAKLDWRYTPARWNLAKIFKSLGKYDWAAKVFHDLVRAAPGDFRACGELGFLYRDYFNDQEQARFWWFESLRLNPRQQQIIDALAQAARTPAPGGYDVGSPVPATGPADARPEAARTPDEESSDGHAAG